MNVGDRTSFAIVEEMRTENDRFIRMLSDDIGSDRTSDYDRLSQRYISKACQSDLDSSTLDLVLGTTLDIFDSLSRTSNL